MGRAPTPIDVIRPLTIASARRRSTSFLVHLNDPGERRGVVATTQVPKCVDARPHQ